ncbi:MAG: phosphoribosylanthranilate isomerase [Deltaproteobacteria bacterium]
MVKVKICGITSLEDALYAAEAGADALGFVFWEKSPRYIEPMEAWRIKRSLPPFILTVGVFVNTPFDTLKTVISSTRIDCVQLHGDESPRMCQSVGESTGKKVIKAFRIREHTDIDRLDGYKVDAHLLDTYREGTPGGTGETFDWDMAVEAKKNRRIILSGGLTPENISKAIKLVRPYAVDVSSGVESRPGKKDPEKIKRFMEQIRHTN